MIPKKEVKRIAIIGAGWMGIGCLKTLLEEGHLVDVYEKNDDVGGTWHPGNCYAGLGIHGTVTQVQYADFPFPSNIEASERVTSEQIFSYLKDYCKNKNLYEHIVFNAKILKINYDTKKNLMTVFYNDINTNKIYDKTYDYVVQTHGYTEHIIPNFKNKDLFSGEIIHSFDASEEKIKSLVLENKKITILGANKAGTDLVLSMAKYGYKFTWLYRKNYWFMRYDPYRRVVEHKKENKIKDFFYKLIVSTGLVVSTFPKFHHYFWRATNVIHTFGEKHSDPRKFHVGWLDDSQMNSLKHLNKKYGVKGEIEALEKKGIRLTNKQFIESDVIVCCTGSGPNAKSFNIEIDGKPFPLDKINKIYKGKIIPQLPNLIFTSYGVFLAGTMNGIMNGKWIAQYIELDLREDYLSRKATEYDFPFFSKHLFFSSGLPYLVVARKLQDDFFRDGNLNKMKYFLWLLRSTFDNKPAKPFEFNIPNDLKK